MASEVKTLNINNSDEEDVIEFWGMLRLGAEKFSTHLQ